MPYIYLGQINTKNNKREGRGKCEINNCFLYEGNWQNDHFNGKGRLFDMEKDI